MMGDTGPCGPCSELHVDLTPGPRDLDIPRQIAGRNLVNQGDARCIEIWNLVFIQFNANPDGTFVDLPARHVDTGMGFERVTSMIQGTKGFTDFSENAKISNYETDVFRPIFDELEKLTGKKYGSTLPRSAQNESEQEKVDVAFRVIADHIRTLSFSIADGIQPSNEGRGYVLRRILRRAVRYGRNLGLREPFLGKLVAVLGATMGHIFPEVVTKADLVRKTLTNEEESFFRTLERGIELFESVITTLNEKSSSKKSVILSLSKAQPPENPHGSLSISTSPESLRHPEPVEGSVQSPSFKTGMSAERELILRQAQDDRSVKSKNFPGSEAFKLYDTYGFPLDLTELMARERGMTVDVAEFNRLMDEQKAKGKAAQKKEVITVEGGVDLEKLPPTVFYGYDELQSTGLIVANENGAVAVTETPFYAEMGGQVGDAGEIEVAGKKIAVINTIKSPSGKVYFHKLAEPIEVKPGERVTLYVNEPRRARIEAHHSGTHLLNWALRKVLGNTITQKGSYVGPDRLRFDFSHSAAMTPAELAEVEKLVNEKIEADMPVKWEERSYAEVKGDPSILQFFGDKYGDTVRVVSIGDFSKELCGGTHVRQSGKVGYFKILHEAAIAAGIRRIEAASGTALIEHVHDQLPKQEEQHSILRQRKLDLGMLNSFSGDKTPHAFWQHWEAREAFLRQAAAEVAQHEKDSAKQQEAAFQKRAAADAPVLIAFARSVNEIPFLAHNMVDASAAYLPILADVLKTRWQGVVVLTAVDQGKVALLAAVSPAYTKKVQAGKIIQAIAPLVGGKGGGRPELAQGGGTNPEGVAAALAKAEEILSG